MEKVRASLDPRKPQLLHIATGGGKTRVGNDIAVAWQEEHTAPVLWVTKDWRLLRQALSDLRRRYDGHPVARTGGTGRLLHPLKERGPKRAIFYTTIQTLVRRITPEGFGITPALLVWDECHWGERGKAAKIFTACKRLGVPILGLTATPREDSRYRVAYRKTFADLVAEQYLARPLPEEPVRTGVNWTPDVPRGRDVSRGSLLELATNQKRNRAIVGHYARHAGKFGKTIVFACGKEHCNILVDMFNRLHGIDARPMHSGMSNEENQRMLEDFRSGAVTVLVNMEMLTHGIDVPDAQTVFLCRPTTSDILFSQMIGRAARRTESKTSFHVVEFTDNVREHGHLFKGATEFFKGSSASRDGYRVPGRPSPSPRRERHEFDPTGSPTWVPADSELPESIHGLWFREGQTFGIEFELTSPDGVPSLGVRWKKKAEALRSALETALPPGRVAEAVIEGYAGQGLVEKDFGVWNVEYDQSVGWEVTSPILANREGFQEVDAACRVLDEAATNLGLVLDFQTGTHVHLGWTSKDVEELKRAIRLVKIFEPALATLVAPSRVAAFDGAAYVPGEPNRYCAPIATVLPEARLSGASSVTAILKLVPEQEQRYVTLNLRRLLDIGTVEVRMHSGTVEARKILMWISLWQQILWAAKYGREALHPIDRKAIVPDGDIVALAKAHLPDARQVRQALFLQRLAGRRQEILEGWKTQASLRPWLKYAKKWTSVADEPHV